MPVRFIAFDFDGTLCTTHVWNSLSGAGPSATPVPPPYSRTEKGQIVRLLQIDTTNQYGGHGGFSVAALGGKGRIETIRFLLEKLNTSGVECVVCSKSLVGPLQYILDQAGLLTFFSKVFGNIGIVLPVTDFDMQCQNTDLGSAARYLGNEEVNVHHCKRSTLAACLARRGLRANEAIFIDDMPQEIHEVAGVCRTLHVAPLQGMGQKEFNVLLSLALEASEKITQSEATRLAVARVGQAKLGRNKCVLPLGVDAKIPRKTRGSVSNELGEQASPFLAALWNSIVCRTDCRNDQCRRQCAAADEDDGAMLLESEYCTAREATEDIEIRIDSMMQHELPGCA